LVDAARAAQDGRGVGLVDVVIVGAVNQAVNLDAKVVGEILAHIAQLLFEDGNMLADGLGGGVGRGRRRHHNRLLDLLDLAGGLGAFLAQVAYVSR